MAVNPSAQDACRNAGLAYAPCGKVFGPDEVRLRADVFDAWNPLSLDQSLQYLKAQGLAETCRELEHACQNADLLIASTVQGVASLAHERTRIPWISVGLNASEYPHADMPNPRKNLPPSEEEYRAQQVWQEQHNQLRREVGLPPHDLQRWPEHLPVTHALLASSAHFSQPSFPKVPITRQTGFWFSDFDGTWTPPEDLKAFLAAGAPPLILSLSSLPVSDPARVVRVHAEAAAHVGHRLLILKGWAGLDASNLPEEVGRIVHEASYVPHDWLFARSAALIHHGGIGTLARGLMHGLPMLVEPYGNDQFFNAQRVILLGVGAAMHPHKLTVEGLTRVLKEKILLPQVRQQALDVGERLKSEDGLNDACLLVEHVLKNQPWN